MFPRACIWESNHLQALEGSPQQCVASVCGAVDDAGHRISLALTNSSVGDAECRLLLEMSSSSAADAGRQLPLSWSPIIGGATPVRDRCRSMTAPTAKLGSELPRFDFLPAARRVALYSGSASLTRHAANDMCLILRDQLRR